MKRWKNYKELAVLIYEALNNKNLSNAEKQNDIKLFGKFVTDIINILYFLFGMFSLISIYYFITRAIL